MPTEATFSSTPENMSEGKLSRHQTELLKQFRANLSDLLKSCPTTTDAELLKWLRGKNFDLKKAERNFRQVNFHRKMVNADKINETYIKPKILQEYERTCFLGFCKDGTPVRYAMFNIDYYGFIQSLSHFDMTMYFLDIMEGDDKLMREENMKTGSNHNSVIYICDFEGYSFQDLTYKCVIDISLEYVRIFQEYYPERWKYMIFINAPFLFDKLLNLLKPILKNTFLEKIKIASKSTTLQLLRECIDDDLIPVKLGGKRMSPKGDYQDIVNPYAKIPEEYYLKNSTHLIDETDPGVKAVTIRAKCCYNVPLIVKEADSKLRMEFRTENAAINFAVLYRQFGSDPEDPDLPESDEYIDPDDGDSNVLFCAGKMKVQSHITPNDGTFTAVWPGIYIVQFDNTGSWFGSRKLYYRMTVTPPNA